MGTRNHDLEHASLDTAHVIDVDPYALADTIMFGGNFLAQRHDAFYAFGFVEVE